jgi:hypothetical protein
MNLLLPVGAGLGLLLLFSGTSKADTKKQATSPAGPLPPKTSKTAVDFQARIGAALSAGDADGLMAIANEMQAAGLTSEAEALRTVALNLKQMGALSGAGVKVPPVSPGQPVVTPSQSLPNPPLVVVPPVVSPSSVPLPAGVSVSSDEARRLQVAQAMAVDLRNTSRYKENQSLVRRFQEQEGLVVDGKYGPKSALALASLGIIPPRPRYWTRKTVQADKKAYAAEMLSRAATDLPRQADWTAASKVQNDPVQ